MSWSSQLLQRSEIGRCVFGVGEGAFTDQQPAEPIIVWRRVGRFANRRGMYQAKLKAWAAPIPDRIIHEAEPEASPQRLQRAGDCSPYATVEELFTHTFKAGMLLKTRHGVHPDS